MTVCSLGAPGPRRFRRAGDRLAQGARPLACPAPPALAPAARASSLDYLGRLARRERRGLDLDPLGGFPAGNVLRRSLGAPRPRRFRRAGDRLALRGSTARLSRPPAFLPRRKTPPSITSGDFARRERKGLDLEPRGRFPPRNLRDPGPARFRRMGELYRAGDTKLDRDVALKVLPHHQPGPGRAERFEREAKAIAAPRTRTSSPSSTSATTAGSRMLSWSCSRARRCARG